MTDVEASLLDEIVRLNKVIRTLTDGAERALDSQGADSAQLRAAAILEKQITARTGELEAALRENARINGALRESEAKYRALVDQSLVGIAIIDDGRFTYTNPHFNEIFGYEPDEMLKLGPGDVAIAEDEALVAEQIRQRLSGETDRVHYQLRGLHKNGTQLDIEIFGNIAEMGGKQVLISVVQDVTERTRTEQQVRTLQQKLREQSLRDPLTKLYNRRYMEESLRRELLLAEREQYPISLIMSDLDHFKTVNDRHGHQAGDEVLRMFSDLLARTARQSDINCRFGGEEFLLALPGMTKNCAAERAEQVRKAFSATPIAFHGTPIAVTASFGVATYPDDGRSYDELIAKADAALYAAKKAGRNQVAVKPAPDGVS